MKYFIINIIAPEIGATIRYYFFNFIGKKKPKSYFEGRKNALNALDQGFVNVLVGILVIVLVVTGVVYLILTLF